LEATSLALGSGTRKLRAGSTARSAHFRRTIKNNLARKFIFSPVHISGNALSLVIMSLHSDEAETENGRRTLKKEIVSRQEM
jgi:hypothetical protein